MTCMSIDIVITNFFASHCCCWVPCIVYFSRHFVPVFKSRDLSSVHVEASVAKRCCVCDSLEVTTRLDKTRRVGRITRMIRQIRTRTINGIVCKQTGASHWSVIGIKVSELE